MFIEEAVQKPIDTSLRLPRRQRHELMLADVRRQTPLFLACVLLGILFVLQFRTQRNIGYSPNANENVRRIILYQETERNKMMADLKDMREKLQKYENAMEEKGNQRAMQLLKDELDKARMQAGLVPVQGPGLIVKLDDSPRKPGNDDPYFYIIHDVDIQAVINELWAAGAEAVAVNDQRVVTSTSVRCVGPTVLVNAVRLTPPYMIRAVGAPSTLETALKMPGGVMASLQGSITKGVRIDIQKAKSLQLPEFKGSGGFRYAEPVSAR